MLFSLVNLLGVVVATHMEGLFIMEAVAGVKAEPVVKTNKLQALVLGLQHVLAMYSGGILVPLLIGAALHFTPQQMAYLISADIFMTGIGTLLQLKSTRLTGIAICAITGIFSASCYGIFDYGDWVCVDSSWYSKFRWRGCRCQIIR